MKTHVHLFVIYRLLDLNPSNKSAHLRPHGLSSRSNFQDIDRSGMRR